MDAKEIKDRDTQGRFAAGNKTAVGAVHKNARSIQHFQQELYKTVKLSDVRIIVKKLIRMAKKGDTYAAEKVLDRVLGKPTVTQIFVDESVPRRIRYSVEPPSRDAGDMPDEVTQAIDKENQGESD